MGRTSRRAVVNPTLSPAMRRRPDLAACKLELQALESRDAPAVANVLANNMAADPTSQDTQSETSLIVFGSTVLASYNDSAAYVSGGGSNHFTGWSRSTDGGATFTDLGILPGNSDFGDPVFARNSTTGRVYLTTLSANPAIEVFRSDDGGASFQPSVNAYPGIAGAALDKQWIAVDNFPGAGNGNVYLVAMDFGSTTGIKITRSLDHGSTWAPTSTPLATGTVQGAWVAVGLDHSVNVFYLNNSAGVNSIRMRKSIDQGATFAAPVTVATLVGTLSNGGLNLGSNRTNSFPQVVVNPVSGNMYLVYNDDVAGADRANVFFRQSTDGGATWSAAATLNDDGTTRDNWQPSLAVTPDGTRLFVGFYDRRNDPANSAIEYFGVNGAISGGTVTFGRNYKISTSSFGVVVGVDPVVNSTYMGDYDSAGADNSFFYAIWGDNRDNSLGRAGKQANVRVAKIPVAGPAGPTVFSSTPNGVVGSAQTQLDIQFNQPMDAASFSIAADVVSFTGPTGNLLPQITGFSWVTTSLLRINFTSQGAVGGYNLLLGPNITAGGVSMDEDFNGTPGQVSDRYAAFWQIPAPRVALTSPNGVMATPLSQIDFTFDQNMDQTSFSIASDVASFIGPNGNLLGQITGFSWQSATVLRVTFNPQSTTGVYNLTIGPQILGVNGAPLDQDGDGSIGEPVEDRFTTAITLDPCVDGDTFGYIAAAYTFDASLNLVEGVGGALAVAALNSADLVAGTIPLGTNTFRYYGTTYTGSNQLFLSPKGLVTFGTSTTSFSNGDLTASPSQAAIAVLWDDYVTNINSAPNDQVLYRFDDVNADTVPDFLVIEWSDVRHFSVGGTNTGTWQLIMQLNTGTTPGYMIFNYRDLDVGSATYNNGASSTVGIKNSGTQGGNRLLVSQNTNASPFVGTGKALKVFINNAPTANAGGPYAVAAGGSLPLNGSASTDPDEPSTNLRYRWDLDGDGIFGELGGAATRGDELGPTPTFSAVGLIGPSVFNVSLRVLDCADLVSTQVVGITINAAGDTTAPTITGVFFDGLSWSSGFRAAAGDGTFGYPAQTGANQLRSMPWSTINTIYVVFSESMTVLTDDQIGIRGINVPNYPIASVTMVAANIAKITLTTPIDTDRILLDVDGDGDSGSAVSDLAGNKLAGTFTEEVSSFPTAGAAAVDFKFRFVVAVGDVDRNGQVRNADLNAVRNNLFVDVGAGGYSIFADIDGNGQTRNLDLNATRNHLFIDPPPGPGPLRAVGRGATAPMVGRSSIGARFVSGATGPVEVGSSLRRRPPVQLPTDVLDHVMQGLV